MTEEVTGQGTGASRPPRRSSVKSAEYRRRLARAFAEDPSISLADAAKKAGSKAKTRKGLAISACHVTHTKSFQEQFRELMDKDVRLKDQKLLDKLADGLAAKRVQFFADKGRVKDRRVTDDHGTRYSYLDLACRLKGLGNRVEVTGAGGAPLVPPSALASLGEAALANLVEALGGESPAPEDGTD